MSRALCRYTRYLCSNHQAITPFRNSNISASLSPIRLNSTIVHAADLRFGQPLHETHPHLLEAGEGRDDISLEQDLFTDKPSI
jgi:hypothetical protein